MNEVLKASLLGLWLLFKKCNLTLLKDLAFIVFSKSLVKIIC